MRDKSKNSPKAQTANPGKQPSTCHRETDGDVLLPLLDAASETSAEGDTGTLFSSLPCDENGDVLLPLLGDEKKTPAHGNNNDQPLLLKDNTVQKYWTVSFQADKVEYYVEVLDHCAGTFRVLSRTPSEQSWDDENYCPHVLLYRVTQDDDEAESSEVIHVVVGVDFKGATHFEIETFISALINYATDAMYTFIETTSDLKEFTVDFAINH